MNSVAHLAQLLAPPQASADEIGDSPGAATGELDAVIVLLAKKVSAGSRCGEPVDQQREVVQRFWEAPRLETLREARLVAFGLCLPAGPEGGSVIEDKRRLDALLQAADGWLKNPRWYRRCYQGLVWSYFNHDRRGENESPAVRANWLRLRDYLHRRAPATLDARANPDWVKTVNAHPSLFGDAPCEDFVGRLLCGDRTELEALCAQVGIGESSWFLRALVEAQLLAATRRSHDEFRTLLPAMLEMLSGGRAWRDAGTEMLLERYAQIPLAPVHEGLRDAVARAWGCPWKPVDALRWEGIGEAARKLAGDWMKANLIDAFFSLVSDSSGARRAAFWKRYLHSIRSVEFAAGDGGPHGGETLQSVLRGCADGLVTPLRDGRSTDAALVLTIGRARLVTFVDATEPVFAYDLRKPTTFDMSQPLAIGVDAANSLRRSTRDLCLFHRDGVDDWRQWEQQFETALKDKFDLRVGAPLAADKSAFVDLADVTTSPGLASLDFVEAIDRPVWHCATNGEDVHWQTAEAMSVPYSRPDLEVLARVHALRLVEEGGKAGTVRVLGDAIDHRIALVLERWGFARMGGGEWCR